MNGAPSVVAAQRRVLRPEKSVTFAARDTVAGGADVDPSEAGATLRDRDVDLVRMADEAEHERRRRPLIDLVGRGDLLDASPVQHRDTIGELERLVLIVGDEHRRVTRALMDLAQPTAQILAHLGVERAERLVEQ